ncbi:MAG: hypothetical protein NVS1B4_00320 [Gemmatimonadaceae bacterium]
MTFETHPADGDARVVLAGLRAYNAAVIGYPGETPVGVFVRNERRAVVGGLLGHVKWRWL